MFKRVFSALQVVNCRNKKQLCIVFSWFTAFVEFVNSDYLICLKCLSSDTYIKTNWEGLDESLCVDFIDFLPNN